jgi:pilus assembly protein Flp/PilA
MGLTQIQTLLARVFSRQDGQALVEYSLILALISIVAITLLTSIGNDVINFLNGVANSF